MCSIFEKIKIENKNPNILKMDDLPRKNNRSFSLGSVSSSSRKISRVSEENPTYFPEDTYFTKFPADVQSLVLQKFSPDQLDDICSNPTFKEICQNENFIKSYLNELGIKVEWYIVDSLKSVIQLQSLFLVKFLLNYNRIHLTRINMIELLQTSIDMLDRDNEKSWEIFQYLLENSPFEDAYHHIVQYAILSKNLKYSAFNRLITVLFNHNVERFYKFLEKADGLYIKEGRNMNLLRHFRHKDYNYVVIELLQSLFPLNQNETQEFIQLLSNLINKGIKDLRFLRYIIPIIITYGNIEIYHFIKHMGMTINSPEDFHDIFSQVSRYMDSRRSPDAIMELIDEGANLDIGINSPLLLNAINIDSPIVLLYMFKKMQNNLTREEAERLLFFINSPSVSNAIKNILVDKLPDFYTIDANGRIYMKKRWFFF